MGDLFSLLSTSSSGLAAHRAAAQTAQHNLANVNTEGYSRQRVTLEAAQPAGRYGQSYLGRGVILDSITRARDSFLERQMGSALSDARASQSEADALTALSAFDVEAPGAVPGALASFFGSMRDLVQNPNDQGARGAALSSAEQLARSFQQAASQIDGARRALDTSVSAHVEEINGLAAQVASLNRDIQASRGSGQPPNDLLDARQRAVDELKKLTGAHEVMTGTGDVHLSLPGGGALVHEHRSATLMTSPDGTNSGHLGLSLQAADGSPPRPLASTSFSGALGGTLAARDGALASAQAELDQLAFDLAGALNTVHQAGFAADGTTGHDLFDVGATPAGAAAAFSVSAAVAGQPGRLALASDAAGLPGGTQNLEALLAVETQALASGQTASDAFGSMVQVYGSATQDALTRAEHDAGVLAHLTGMRESVRGVSIDEEMIEMTKAQRAFEALGKVIQTANEMLDSVIRLKS